MKAQFDSVTLKIWFKNTSTSRNVHNVVEIEHVGNLMKILDANDNILLVNFDNVNLIEEI